MAKPNFEELAIEITQDLIRFGAFNPPGYEEKSAAYCANLLDKHGFDVKIDTFENDRKSVVATYGNENDIALILYGHIDVVPVSDGWSYEPLSGLRKDGYIHGRGASDMLGGCAAIMAAACELVSEWESLKTDRGIMLLLVGDEEGKNKGIYNILKNFDLKADAAIVAEPTELEIHLGNRGYASYFIRTKGKACHASHPEQGINAIYKMTHVISGIEKYVESLRNVTDPYLGAATASVGTIQGGTALNTVPQDCEIELERRLLPGETLQSVREEMMEYIGEDCELIDRTFIPACLIDISHPFVELVKKEFYSLFHQKANVSIFEACTETSMISEIAGIPSIICGPGELRYAHAKNERCSEEQIRQAVQLYAAILHSKLGNVVC